MAFKSIIKKTETYDDIESLFRDLNTTDIESLYAHQADILRHYQEHAHKKSNVAIELPTGSGKTLVGLLIAEYNRRKYNQKVLYICPTIQLVNQVVQVSNELYGINCSAFTGSHNNYSPADKFAYKNAETVAVTTYSSLFNTNPWFEEPDLIIIDDAHTSENYISSCWSLSIHRSNDSDIYSATIETLKEDLTYSIYDRLNNESPDPLDKGIVEKFPNSKLFERKDEIFDLLSIYLEDHKQLRYPWYMLKDHLEACQIFISWKEILIRPIIPPSLENIPFKKATQRIFMSATLGQGGDLERITGVDEFYKIPIPTGWDKQGNGRRFFMFPNVNMEIEESDKLVSELLKITNRTVILVSSKNDVNNIGEIIDNEHPDIEFFTVNDIEKSKKRFIESDNAVVTLANRFDGIDFAGDQCRSLFLIGIPYASNLQEKFMQSRMNASIIFFDRNKTRLIQAIGRCTRSPKDYSAICVLGDKDLSEWLLLKNKTKYLHPEVQAEVEFGLEQSKSGNVDEFIENYREFIGQTENWKAANAEIIELRKEKKQEDFIGSTQLGQSAKLEVKFQYALWNKNYEKCLDYVVEIISSLEGGKELSGYRAFWNYQGASIANIMFSETGHEKYRRKKKEYFDKLIQICPTATWLRSISSVTDENYKYDENLVWNIENLQGYLAEINISRKKKYLNYLREIESFIASNDLENLNLHIGKLLGYKSLNNNSTAAPDPYWISSDNLVFVFEDKFYDNTEENIVIKHIKQAALHKEWIKENVREIAPDAQIITIFLTNRKSISKEGKTFVKGMKYWNYNNFIEFSKEIIKLARSYQMYYGGANDDNWKDSFIEEYSNMKIGPMELISQLADMNDL